MAATTAASIHAPLTAAVMIFELSGDYPIVLPLLMATVVSTSVSRRLGSESVYESELRRRGLGWDLTLEGRRMKAPAPAASTADESAPACLLLHSLVSDPIGFTAPREDPPSATLVGEGLRVRQHHPGTARHRLVVADEPPRLVRIVRLEIHRPAKADRLVPQLGFDAERTLRLSQGYRVPNLVAAAYEVRVSLGVAVHRDILVRRAFVESARQQPVVLHKADGRQQPGRDGPVRRPP